MESKPTEVQITCLHLPACLSPHSLHTQPPSTPVNHNIDGRAYYERANTGRQTCFCYLHSCYLLRISFVVNLKPMPYEWKEKRACDEDAPLYIIFRGEREGFGRSGAENFKKSL